MAYEIFQWSGGTVGKHTARAALQRDALELIGMHVYSPDKVGKDVGDTHAAFVEGVWRQS
jgi:hypothetical protein